MRRRNFIAGLCAASLPAVARAQIDRVRRISVLMAIAESDADSPARVAAFQQSLANLGRTVGRNLRIDYRWAGGDLERIRTAVAELIGLAPDVILADGTAALRAMRQATTSIPIVFTVVSEPVAAGFVASLARPGGNITGFSNLEPGVAAKWLELLRQISPGVTRAALMFNPDTTPVPQQQSGWALAAAEKLGISAVVVPVRNPVEIEAAVTMAGRESGGGLILPQDPFTVVHRQLIVELAARHRLPAVYAFRYFTAAGGLLSYGVDVVEQFRQAATYIDRILRGTNPADLPVQQPTKFELVLNLKTAKALGLSVPETLLATADEVFQ
jgi:putative tryptophan/tyrosine transport system substrate-binding protein